MMHRDTEADLIGGMLTIGAAGFAGYVSHTLYAASSWLPEGLYKDTFNLSALMTIVTLGLAARGVYLLCMVAGAIRRERRATR